MKNPMANKLEGEEALMAWPLVEELFSASLINMRVESCVALN